MNERRVFSAIRPYCLIVIGRRRVYGTDELDAGDPGVQSVQQPKVQSQSDPGPHCNHGHSGPTPAPPTHPPRHHPPP
eukprot:COSAG02_NODE_13875_length_1336_cov_1.945837_1_plen_76_part_10